MSSSIRCFECGLVNFVTAERCKKCGTEIETPAVSAEVPAPTIDSSNESWEFVPTKRDLGGWLIVFAISLYGTILSAAYGALQDFLKLMDVTQEVIKPGQDLSIRQSVENAFWFEFIFLVVMLCLSILLAVRLTQKSSSFPRFAIGVLSLKLLYNVISFFILWDLESQVLRALSAVKHAAPPATDFEKLYLTTVIGFFVSILWICYFRSSNRVRETFLN